MDISRPRMGPSGRHSGTARVDGDAMPGGGLPSGFHELRRRRRRRRRAGSGRRRLRWWPPPAARTRPRPGRCPLRPAGPAERSVGRLEWTARCKPELGPEEGILVGHKDPDHDLQGSGRRGPEGCRDGAGTALSTGGVDQHQLDTQGTEGHPEVLQRARRPADTTRKSRAPVDDIEAPHGLPGRVPAHPIVSGELPVGREALGELPVGQPGAGSARTVAHRRDSDAAGPGSGLLRSFGSDAPGAGHHLREEYTAHLIRPDK